MNKADKWLSDYLGSKSLWGVFMIAFIPFVEFMGFALVLIAIMFLFCFLLVKISKKKSKNLK